MPKTTEINSEETKKYTQFLQDKANLINLYLELSEVKEYSVLTNLLARLEVLLNFVSNDGKLMPEEMELMYNFANMILSKCKLVNLSYNTLINNYKEFARLFSVINRGDIADIDYSWIDAKNKFHALYPLVNGLGKMTIRSGQLGQTINIVNAQPIFSGDNVIVPVFIDTEYLERPIITTLLSDIPDDDVWDVNDLSIGVGTYEEFIGDEGLVYQDYNNVQYEYVASEDKYYLRFDLLDLYKTSYNMPWVVSVMDTNNMVRVDYIVYFNIQDSPEPPEPEPIPDDPVDPVDPDEDNNEPGDNNDGGETGPK